MVVRCLAFVLTILALPSWVSAGPGRRIRGVDADGDVVFTFDDGPRFETTPAILDELDRNGIRAVFFVNGYRFAGRKPSSSRNRAVLRDIHRRGHIIGNHTFGHSRLRDLTPKRQRWQILRNEEAILRIAGVRPHYFRPPYGKGSRDSRVFVHGRGYLRVLWNIEPRDHFIHSAKAMAARTVEMIKVQDGGIVILHDTFAWSLKGLRLILAQLAAENQARAANGQRPFRVVDPEELIERSPDPVMPAVGTHRSSTGMTQKTR